MKTTKTRQPDELFSGMERVTDLGTIEERNASAETRKAEMQARIDEVRESAKKTTRRRRLGAGVVAAAALTTAAVGVGEAVSAPSQAPENGRAQLGTLTFNAPAGTIGYPTPELPTTGDAEVQSGVGVHVPEGSQLTFQDPAVITNEFGAWIGGTEDGNAKDTVWFDASFGQPLYAQYLEQTSGVNPEYADFHQSEGHYVLDSNSKNEVARLIIEEPSANYGS